MTGREKITVCGRRKESCKAGFSACGGSRKRYLPIRRSAILAERFLFHRNTISYEIKKRPESISISYGLLSGRPVSHIMYYFFFILYRNYLFFLQILQYLLYSLLINPLFFH